MHYGDTGVVMDKKHGGAALSRDEHHQAGLTISVGKHAFG